MSKEGKIVFCTGGGCTAKLGAGVLSRILEKLPRGEKDPNLLVGYDSRDDAAVYRVTEDLALVQTVDFFPPMVDDPYTFGQIAAANALSDIYAMGGEVKTALNLVCFPESMDLNVLGEILRGGAEKVAEAGGTLAGGHSIADTGVKIDITDDGKVSICGTDKEMMDKALEMVKIITTDFEEGQIFKGKVVSIKEFGAFIEFAPGKEGMVHISKIAKERINRVEDVLTLGDVVTVVCLGKDKMGRISFSMKDVAQQ